MAAKSGYIKKIIKASIALCAIVPILFGCYFVNVHQAGKQFDNVEDGSGVALRKFPYPFRASMTIASDIDDTYTLDEFIEIQRFLNTSEETTMGKGVGLDIGNSFHMYETGNISYFNSDEKTAKAIKDFIQSGTLDFIHSFGHKEGFSRDDAITYINELKSNDCFVDVWVDHGSGTTDNFGNDVTIGYGDKPESIAYHADITIPYGIKFVWLGRVSMIVGQSVEITPNSFINIMDTEYPMHSMVNIGKEFTKSVAPYFGNKKYYMHKDNELVKPVELDDGQKVYEFVRFSNHWKGAGREADAKGLAYSLSKRNLDRLKDVSGYMIVYTHFGGNAGLSQYLPKETVDAIRNLADEYNEGNIYVTTTSKLLNYYVNHKNLVWSHQDKGQGAIITVEEVADPVFGSFVPTVKDLQGVTFYVEDSSIAKVYIGKDEVVNLQRNLKDHTGKESVTIPLERISFPVQYAKSSNLAMDS